MKLKVLILGYGEMGHAMEYLLAGKHDVRIWSLETQNSLENELPHAEVIFFCLPVNAHVEIAQRIASHLTSNCLCLSIAKGLDETGKTASQIFSSIFSSKQHYGVLYGPMISEEIRLGRLAFADVALTEPDNFQRVRSLFLGSTLICKQVDDMLGSSWSVILKNVYAILFGIADELQLGDNVRGYLMVKALNELSAIVKVFGGESHTPYSYAGLGDLLTTASSKDSHHHELGRQLAKGNYSDISGEGVHTLKMVEKHKLFNYESYPLYKLVHDIVATPEQLKGLVEAYFQRLQTW